MNDHQSASGMALYFRANLRYQTSVNNQMKASSDLKTSRSKRSLSTLLGLPRLTKAFPRWGRAVKNESSKDVQRSARVAPSASATTSASSALVTSDGVLQSHQPRPVLDFGYSRSINKAYHMKTDGALGTGGNAVVRRAVRIDTGIEYACKSIPKVLDPSKFSPKKCEHHADAIKLEVSVLQRLRGCLNVVELHDVFEDEVGSHSYRKLACAYRNVQYAFDLTCQRPVPVPCMYRFTQCVLRTMCTS